MNKLLDEILSPHVCPPRQNTSAQKNGQAGQGITEYIILIVFLAISVIGGLVATGTSLGDAYHSAADALGLAGTTVTPQVTPTPMEDITVSVSDQNGEALAGVPVLAFNSGDNFLNLKKTTGENGQARFTGFDPGGYSFRADYQGQDFWSNTINYPGQHQASIQIERFTITVKVVQEGSDVGVPGVPVYAFSEGGNCTGQTGTTGPDGQTELQLVSGNHKFRADYNRETYWSETVNVPAASSVTIEVGLAQVTVNVRDPLGNNIANVRVYAFQHDGSYLGMTGTTNQSGQVIFELENGNYKFRADYQGATYWSDPITVPDSTSATITVGLGKLHVSVTDQQGAPLSNVWVYVFPLRGWFWPTQYGVTDAYGNIYFDANNLNANQRYRVLAYDYYGSRQWRWSPAFRPPITETIQIKLP